MAGSLTGEDNQTQLQRPCDGLYRNSVGVGAGQQSIGPGSSKAALPGLDKEELWMAGYGNT